MDKKTKNKQVSDESLEIIRHDCAHVLAEAVQNLYNCDCGFTTDLNYD